jgi:cytochrome c oxidase cbb3-type subunit III
MTKKDQLLGHASDNDGIDEYDNALPGWWLGLFLFTILWAIGYAVDYHFLRPTSQTARYEEQMAAAKARWPESTAKALVYDDPTLQAGGELYATTCVACHGAELGGGIGPSLVDTAWIHGADPEQIRATITNGVTAKGMPAWGPVLGPDKVAKVTAFVFKRAEAAGATGANAVLAGATPSGAPAAAGTPVATSGDPGEQVYKQNCVVCHGDNLEGKVGPSLVDAAWIHGGTLPEIEKTIVNGVPEKGMVSWGPLLTADQIKQVATYIHTKANASVQATQ